MTLAKDYASVMSHRGGVMEKALGMNFSAFESSSIALDCGKVMSSTGFSMEKVERVQGLTGVGNTPFFTLRNLAALVRRCAKPDYGATICVKDEVTSSSGPFKVRRAACAVAFAETHGYKGIVTTTSGNYDAAVASQVAIQSLKYIIAQEAYNFREVGQPEIIEKAWACETMGTEVVQIIVGPELSYESLSLLEDTGFFNASLYPPFGITDIEVLGHETALQCRAQFGRDPDMVVCTNAGGGMATGTARGLRRAGASHTQIVVVSTDLAGLHMASDTQFSQKSCTTGHTGFGIPFTNWPDHFNTPCPAIRPLCYMDHYIAATQGEVMYITELLANLEGLKRGPVGNTPLAAAFCLAQELPEDQILVVSEAKYTGVGKYIQPRLDFTRGDGIEVHFGKPGEEMPSISVILPVDLYQFQVRDLDLDKMRHSLIKTALKAYTATPTEADYEFLVQEANKSVNWVREQVAATVPTL